MVEFAVVVFEPVAELDRGVVEPFVNLVVELDAADVETAGNNFGLAAVVELVAMELFEYDGGVAIP
jgi:hypothetical protein